MNIKHISLKRYLFLLVAGLVVILALVQIAFVYYIDRTVQQEVTQKSKNISAKVLDFIADDFDTKELKIVTGRQTFELKGEPQVLFVEDPNFIQEVIDNNNKDDATVHYRIEHSTTVTSAETSQDQMNIDERLRLKKMAHERISDGEDADHVIRKIKEHFQDQIKNVQFREGKLHNVEVSIESDGKMTTRQLDLDNRFHESPLEKYLGWLVLMILSASTLALAAAYWLSHHFSRPLTSLTSGFDALSNGQLGTQITPEGVAEMQKTMDSFNTMSTRLKSLSDIEQKYQQQQQLVELGDVAKGIAHSLRNPINTIGLSIDQLFSSNVKDEDKLQLHENVRNKIAAIDKTIKAFLTLTTTGINRDDSITVVKVIQDILLELAISGQGNQKIEVTGDKGLTVQGSESEIRALLHTMIVNAIEASTPEQRIDIDLASSENNCIIKVTDQGVGIPDHIKPHLFEPHISSKAEGAGMGLYIAKRLARLHYDGDLILRDNEPQGCVAELTLNLQQEQVNG